MQIPPSPPIMDKSELQRSTSLEPRPPVREILLDLEKNIWIKMGYPPASPVNSALLMIPDEPYVLKVDEMLVSDQNHNNAKLKDVLVVFGHGHNTQDKWVFNNGQDVEETVEAYEKYAKENHLAPIEFIVACNPHPSPEKQLALQIKVGPKEINRPLGYAVGYDVPVSTSIEDGRIQMSVGDLNSPAFIGLDPLIDYKSINLNP